MTLVLSSPAFQQNGNIPAKYTCEGENISPPLDLNETPVGTASYAIIVDDTDAPNNVFTHWLLFNIPATLNVLPDNIPAEAWLSYGVQGQNDFGELGYGGPCPPPGKPHHYRFKLYALDQKLDIEPGASKAQLLAAMEGHIIDQYELVGLFQR